MMTADIGIKNQLQLIRTCINIHKLLMTYKFLIATSPCPDFIGI